MRELKLLGICGSLRRQSTNAGLLRAAIAELPEGVTMEIADLSAVPFYNADIAEKPAAVKQLLAQIGAADALVLACPEYNYSMAPAMKNALDWASRQPDYALLAGKASARPSAMASSVAWTPRAPNTICGRFACFWTCTR